MPDTPDVRPALGYEWATSWPGVLSVHADDCPVRDGDACTCGPLGYRASTQDPVSGGRVVSPLMGSEAQAVAWRGDRAGRRTAEAERAPVEEQPQQPPAQPNGQYTPPYEGQPPQPPPPPNGQYTPPYEAQPPQQPNGQYTPHYEQQPPQQYTPPYEQQPPQQPTGQYTPPYEQQPPQQPTGQYTPPYEQQPPQQYTPPFAQPPPPPTGQYTPPLDGQPTAPYTPPFEQQAPPPPTGQYTPPLESHQTAAYTPPFAQQQTSAYPPQQPTAAFATPQQDTGALAGRSRGLGSGDTLEDFVEDFLDAAQEGRARDPRGRRYTEEALEELDMVLHGHVVQELGELALGDVRRWQVQALVNELADSGLATRRLRAMVAALRGLFAFALEEHLVETNPADRLLVPLDEEQREATGADRLPFTTTDQLAAVESAPITGRGADGESVIPERVIWQLLKIVAIAFVLIALVLAAESV